MSRVPSSKRGGADDDNAPYNHHAHPYLAHATASSAAVGSTSLTASATSTPAAAATAVASASAVGSSGPSSYRPTAAAGGGSPLLPPYPVPNGKSEPPRTSVVSEEVWAKAIHAVKIQKMSLRQAAQLYGVHHMSLHRRVRGRYASSMPPSSDVRSFLSPDDEAEVLGVLREQFLHEKRITTDDIRFVVRAIASQGGKRSIPPEFPPSRWIHDFKRAHGFVKLNSYAYPPTGTSQHGDENMDDMDDSGSNYSGYSSHRSHPRDRIGQEETEQNGRRSEVGSVESNYGAADREEFNPPVANGDAMYDAGLTTGSSSGGSYENGESEKRTYRLSHTVPPEIWEKAIAAVEQQGMSLRAAAKMYGVHFAALHRRVKKRAQGEQASGIEGYFQPDDEAGIIRVVVARAELGVLMTFEELMDLAQRAALRNLPDLSVEAARKLMTRFQTRNEHSIRHIIADWPSPRSNPLMAVPRVVNNVDGAVRAGHGPSTQSVSSRGTANTPPPQGMRNYASAARTPTPSMNELPLGRASSLPPAQQNGDLAHSSLPPLRSEFPPPPPASSVFSRHTMHGSNTGALPRHVAQPMSSSALANDRRYMNHDDRVRRDRRPYDGRSSYVEEDERNRRDSGDGSSDGDAVMFV